MTTAETPPVAPAPPTLARAPLLGYRERRLWWLRWRSGTLHDHDGERHLVGAPSLSDVLGTCSAYPGDHTVYVVGGWDAASAPPRAYLTGPDAHGWHRTGPRDDGATTYRRHGTRVDVRMTAAWFADAADLDLCRRAYRCLEALINRAWAAEVAYARHRYQLRSTPAQTGNELLQACLPFGAQYPAPPAEIADLIAHNIPQARRELLTPPDLGSVDRLYCVDAKLMYVRSLTTLPVGEPTRDAVPVHDPSAPGFYRVDVSVPAGWAHIGLAPTQRETPAGELRTVWPSTPGDSFPAWLGSAQVKLLLAHEWPHVIRERILWPQTAGKGRIPDPLHRDKNPLWRDRLLALREHVETAGARADVSPLVVDALRSILIHTIGTWARRETSIRHFTPYGEEASIPAEGVAWWRTLPTEAGTEWWEEAELSAWSRRFAHPEWAASVWTRGQAWQTLHGLTLPRDWLVASRTDGWWLTHAPDWQYTGRPGSYRLKKLVDGPCSPPVPRYPGDDEPPALFTLLRTARKVVE